MIINTKISIPHSVIPSAISFGKSEVSFSKHLEYHSENIADSGNDHSEKFAGDITKIKEMGLTAYVLELEAEKIEEIRKELLARMGLTEEELAEMPPEQRTLIEEIISDEIEKRRVASSLMKNTNNSGLKQPEKVIPEIIPEFVAVSIKTEQENMDIVSTTQNEE